MFANRFGDLILAIKSYLEFLYEIVKAVKVPIMQLKFHATLLNF